MKPIRFGDLASHSLFTICAEKVGFYERCQKVYRMMRSKDHSVYKKYGPGVSTNKAGKDIILALDDLVFPFAPRKGVRA